MDWRTVLVLATLGVLAVAALWMGIVIRSRGKRIEELVAEKRQVEARLAEAVDVIARMKTQATNEEMSDAEALEKLRDGLAGWTPDGSCGGSG